MVGRIAWLHWGDFLFLKKFQAPLCERWNLYPQGFTIQVIFQKAGSAALDRASPTPRAINHHVTVSSQITLSLGAVVIVAQVVKVQRLPVLQVYQQVLWLGRFLAKASSAVHHPEEKGTVLGIFLCQMLLHQGQDTQQ